MHPDDLIDDIARRMTSGNGLRGSVRQRVRAAIDASPRQSVWSGRLVHAAGLGIACAGVIAVLLVLPASRPEPDTAPAVAARADVPAERLPASEDPGLPHERSAGTHEGSAGTSVPAAGHAIASATQAASALEAPDPIVQADSTIAAAARVRHSAASTGRAGRAPVSSMTASATVAAAGGAATTLQPLAGPDPIVIEPVPMQRLEIAPLTVEAIELTAIAIPPLAPLAAGGV